nr:MAG TPA: hypothetical protein [Caudoviricetes sp.]
MKLISDVHLVLRSNLHLQLAYLQRSTQFHLLTVSSLQNPILYLMLFPSFHHLLLCECSFLFSFFLKSDYLVQLLV